MGVAHTVKPLYKGQGGCGSYGEASLQGTRWVWLTVKPLYKGRVVGGSYGEASLQGTSCG